LKQKQHAFVMLIKVDAGDNSQRPKSTRTPTHKLNMQTLTPSAHSYILLNMQTYMYKYTAHKFKYIGNTYII